MVLILENGQKQIMQNLFPQICKHFPIELYTVVECWPFVFFVCKPISPLMRGDKPLLCLDLRIFFTQNIAQAGYAFDVILFGWLIDWLIFFWF